MAAGGEIVFREVDGGSGDGGSGLSERVYKRLRTALMRAELKPEQHLRIRELAVRMGTSETPVREAIFQLAREGAVEIKPRQYVRVRRVSADEYEEIRDIRLALEPLAGERALPRLRDVDIDGLEALHRQLVAAEAQSDWSTALEANFNFHFGLYGRSGMPSLIAVLETLWIRIGPLLSELYPHAQPTYADRHQHENVLDALRARDSYALREAIRQDLIEGGRGLVKRIRKLEAAGEPAPPSQPFH
jgi:DNA-binding GntR family transcriptional regulator